MKGDIKWTPAMQARYVKLMEKVRDAYKAWQDCTDHDQKRIMGQVWLRANERLDAFVDRYM